MRQRIHGRYRDRSLKTADLTEARRIACLNPPDANPLHAISLKKALLAFQESRQQLLDAPGDAHSIRLNTFKAYKTRISTLVSFFEHQGSRQPDILRRNIGSLQLSDVASYKNWRERQGIMATTIKTELSEINTILSWLYTNGYIPNPLKIKLPRVNTDKYRQPNRLLTPSEEITLWDTLNSLCRSKEVQLQQRWRLYRFWVRWLEDTFTRPHESRLLRFGDVSEYFVNGIWAVKFYTRPETKTGQRFVYASSTVYRHLVKLYNEWKISITADSPLFLLPTGHAPSSSWFSDQWRKLINECGFRSKPRELTQYSLRHQGINALLMQGVAPTKVADLAGHSLAIQQRIYKKYSLEDDHTVLKNSISPHSRNESPSRPNFSHYDLPYPWEIDNGTEQESMDES